MPIQVTEQFEEWLKSTPDALAKMIAVIKQWYEDQNKPLPIGENPETGPDEFEIGGEVELRTIGLTHEDLDTISQGMARAEVKEKALAWVKGFLTAVTI